MAGLKAAITAFHERGEFSEDEYRSLRDALAPASSSSTSQTFDGLVGLFFERHLMNDVRRTELLQMDDESLGRAVRHRFRQLVADEQPTHREYHALRPTCAPRSTAWFKCRRPAPRTPPRFRARAASRPSPSSRRSPRCGASGAASRRRPRRPASCSSASWRAPGEPVSESREFPEVVRTRIDAQRLAFGILNVFSPDERDLLRAVLDGISVDDWAQGRGTSRATAYRLYARLKSLCELELKDRSHRTKLDAIDAMRGQLTPSPRRERVGVRERARCRKARRRRAERCARRRRTPSGCCGAT